MYAIVKQAKNFNKIINFYLFYMNSHSVVGKVLALELKGREFNSW